MSRQMGLEDYYKNDSTEESRSNGTLVDQLRELLVKNGELQEKVGKLNETIKDQNEMIEKQFGVDIEIKAKGKFNNAGESIQPISLSNKVRDIFDNEWRNVMVSLFRGDKELHGIQLLSKLLQDCQSFCQEKAREHLVKFVNPFSANRHSAVEEVIPSRVDQHNLYKLRRLIGLHEHNKLHVINLFVKECRERDDFSELEEYMTNRNCNYTRDVNDNGNEKRHSVQKDVQNNGKVCGAKNVKENRKGHETRVDSKDNGKSKNTKETMRYNGKSRAKKDVDGSGKGKDAEQCLMDEGKTRYVVEDDEKDFDATGDNDIEKCSDVKCDVDQGDDIKCIEDYIRRCCDTCWQCAVSDPPVLLKFDVIGKKFKNISDKFQEYHYNGDLGDKGVCNEVKQVVWPAVVIYNNEENMDILVDNAKGSVILYKTSAL